MYIGHFELLMFAESSVHESDSFRLVSGLENLRHISVHCKRRRGLVEGSFVSQSVVWQLICDSLRGERSHVVSFV